MIRRAWRWLGLAAAAGAFAALSWVIYRGYLTPEMMVYFLSFRWCF